MKKILKKISKSGPLISGLFGMISTGVMLYLTIVMSIANDRMAEANDRMSDSEEQNFVLARYQHTLTLCQKFEDIYGDYKSTDRYEFKIWEENNLDYDIVADSRESLNAKFSAIKVKWEKADTAEKIEYLSKNKIFYQIMMCFEEAKILHTKQLLDVDAFENEFASTMYRLQKVATDPTIDEYISYIRNSSKRPTCDEIWDGYYYCRDKIMPVDHEIKNVIVDSCEMHVKKGDKVQKGQVLMTYLTNENQRGTLKSETDGFVYEIYEPKGRNVVMIRVRKPDYTIK